MLSQPTIAQDTKLLQGQRLKTNAMPHDHRQSVSGRAILEWWHFTLERFDPRIRPQCLATLDRRALRIERLLGNGMRSQKNKYGQAN